MCDFSRFPRNRVPVPPDHRHVAQALSVDLLPPSALTKTNCWTAKKGPSRRLPAAFAIWSAFNRFLGGKAFLRRHVFPLLNQADATRPLRILRLGVRFSRLCEVDRRRRPVPGKESRHCGARP